MGQRIVSSAVVLHPRNGLKSLAGNAGTMLCRIIAFALLITVAAVADQRDIAEWVIRWDGRLLVEGNPRAIDSIADLPAGSFEITAIDLTGGVMVPAELEKLSGLTTLRELYLPGPIWNPGGGGGDTTN